MSKIVLIENTGLIGIKFERALKEHGFFDYHVLESHQATQPQNAGILKAADLLFIDCDNREVEPATYIPKVKALISNHTFIISISSKVNQKYISQLLALGSRDILVKPYSDVKLVEKIFKRVGQPTIDRESTDIEATNTKGRYMPKWTKDLELGIESIDGEHKSLIESYEKLYQEFRQGIGQDYCKNLLEYMQDYVNTHFENEEQLLGEIDYEHFKPHKAMHEAFTKQIEAISSEYESSGITNEMMIRFSLFIKNWWIHHILVEDKKYIDYYHKTKE